MARLQRALALEPDAIYFLSDGEPTDGRPAQIVSAITALSCAWSGLGVWTLIITPLGNDTIIAKAAASGLPVMRAMPLAFPGNALTREFDTQFMFGDALLVAPIIRAGGEVEVALPPGHWYDLNTRKRLAGRQV